MVVCKKKNLLKFNHKLSTRCVVTFLLFIYIYLRIYENWRIFKNVFMCYDCCEL